MGQMASLLSTIRRRLPTSDDCPPDKTPSHSRALSETSTRQTVQNDSNESTRSEDDDRTYKRRRRRSCKDEDERIIVHASDDDSVRADINLLTEPQFQQVTDQHEVDNSVLKELSDLLDEDETLAQKFRNN